MGRIKSKLIKRTGKGLLSETDNFTPGFENNKQMIKGLTPSKKMRNQIAGYITRLKKRQVKTK